MTREETLDGAKECVCKSRQEQYGSVEDSFAKIAALWSAYLGVEISPLDACMMMGQMKVARIKTGVFKEDSFIDACGYIACAAELATKE